MPSPNCFIFNHAHLDSTTKGLTWLICFHQWYCFIVTFSTSIFLECSILCYALTFQLRFLHGLDLSASFYTMSSPNCLILNYGLTTAPITSMATITCFISHSSFYSLHYLLHDLVKFNCFIFLHRIAYLSDFRQWPNIFFSLSTMGCLTAFFPQVPYFTALLWAYITV